MIWLFRTHKFEDVTVLAESFSEIEVDVASSLMQLHATKVSRFQLDRV